MKINVGKERIYLHSGIILLLLKTRYLSLTYCFGNEKGRRGNKPQTKKGMRKEPGKKTLDRSSGGDESGDCLSNSDEGGEMKQSGRERCLVKHRIEGQHGKRPGKRAAFRCPRWDGGKEEGRNGVLRGGVKGDIAIKRDRRGGRFKVY